MVEGITNNKVVEQGISPYNKAENTSSPLKPTDNNTLERVPRNDEFAAKNQKLSKTAKWGLGTAAVIGLGVLAYALTRGRIGSKSVQ